MFFNYFIIGSELKTTGKISKVQYDTYEREIERYGGFKSMNFAETFFFYDSEYVNNLIKFKQSNTLQFFFIICKFIH